MEILTRSRARNVSCGGSPFVVGMAVHGHRHIAATSTEPVIEEVAAAVTFEGVRASVATLYRALGGAEGTEIVAAPAEASDHRPGRLRRIGTPREMVRVADFTGERLRLPPVMDAFPTRELNRAGYLWLAALAACVEMPEPETDPYRADLRELSAIAEAADRAYRLCPGLRAPYGEMCLHLLQRRCRDGLPPRERAVEALILDQLGGGDMPGERIGGSAPRGYRSYAPVPIWLRLLAPGTGQARRCGDEGPAPALPTVRKSAWREARDEASRRDSFIIHRFKSFVAWAESLNINRMTDAAFERPASRRQTAKAELRCAVASLAPILGPGVVQ